MSNDRYEKIRQALANGPTPGPWEPVTDRQYSDLPYLVLGAGASDAKSAEWMPLYVHVGGRSGWMEQKANTLLIAACDPDTIRALLDERDALAAEVERLAEALRKLEERAQRDEALLRQALEALEQIARDLPWELTALQADTIAALRERLGEGAEP